MARRRSSNDDLVSTVARLSSRRGRWWVTLLLILLAVFAWYVRGNDEVARRDGRADPPVVDASDDGRTYRVERVVDGDTFVLEGGERVRMLGVDTPETVKPNTPVQPMGPQASAYTHRVLEGQVVRLGFDKERRDRYGRLLAYVYLGDRMINEELIRKGYGRAQTQYPFSNEMKRRFRAAEAEAQADRLGIWGLPADEQPGGPRPAGRKAA